MSHEVVRTVLSDLNWTEIAGLRHHQAEVISGDYAGESVTLLEGHPAFDSVVVKRVDVAAGVYIPRKHLAVHRKP